MFICLGEKFDIRNCSLWIRGNIQQKFSPIQELMMLTYLTARELSVKRIYLKQKHAPSALTVEKFQWAWVIYYHTKGPFYSDDNVKTHCFGNMRVWYTHVCVTSPCHRSPQLTHIFISPQLPPTNISSLCFCKTDFSGFHTWVSKIFSTGLFMLYLCHSALFIIFLMLSENAKYSIFIHFQGTGLEYSLKHWTHFLQLFCLWS